LKKRKHYVQKEDAENIRHKEVQVKSWEADTAVINVTLETLEVPCSSQVVFPFDIERCNSDGHLFPRAYLPHITKSLDLNESKSAEFLPNPNYLDNQTDLKFKMRTILFTYLTEVHLRLELREDVL